MVPFGIFRCREIGRREKEKRGRLERAEEELSDLKERAEKVHRALTERQKRNHWQESVDIMIKGGRP